jgi:hypothetical protein
VQLQRAYVVGGLQPGAALVVVRLAVVTLPPRSTALAVADCRLVGCSVSRLPLRSRAVEKVSQRVRVCLGPVLAPVPRRACGLRGRLAGSGSCVCYYCSTYYKAVCVGGTQWRTCATRDYEPRPVWMWTSLPITH